MWLPGTRAENRFQHFMFSLIVIILLIICWVLFKPLGRGSLRDVKKWAPRISRLKNPEVAKKSDERIFSYHFPNGEWLFGVCTNSDSFTDGGTFVFKGSQGKVRAFFGLINDESEIIEVLKKSGSLYEFYYNLWRDGMKEHQITPELLSK